MTNTNNDGLDALMAAFQKERAKNEGEDGSRVTCRTQGVGGTGAPAADPTNIFSGLPIYQQ